MSAKILINGKAGVGKSTLIKDLPNTFVVSRDGKAFPFKMPNMTIPTYYDMATVIHGGTIKDADGDEVVIEGVMDVLEKYNEKFGTYPETVVIDSVSKLIQDAIDYANLHYEGFDVHSTINKEVAILTAFIQEELVANGVNVVLVNHVMENDKKGLIPIGQGKFKDKGGFYSEVDHSVLVTDSMKIIHRGASNQARTLLDELPDFQYLANVVNPEKSKKLKEGESYYSLQEHIEQINSHVDDISEEWTLN